jgi:hypothetical protein
MLIELVARIFPVTAKHDPVPYDLGDDGSRRNGSAFSVSPGDPSLRYRKIDLMPSAIDQKIIRRKRQVFNRLFHGQKIGSANVQFIDQPVADISNPYPDSLLFDLME